MTDLTVIHRPFTFPARDGYTLRGTLSELRQPDGHEEPDDDEPTRSTPSPEQSSPATGYHHPFAASRDDAAASDDTDAGDADEPDQSRRRPVPFRRLRRATGSAPEVSDDGDEASLDAGVRDGGTAPTGVVVINGGEGVAQPFYRPFATALATAGYTTISYDYRGIGASKPRDLRTFDATITDWILRDMTGILDWTASRFPDARLFLVGHDIGAQAAGLVDAPVTFAGLAAVPSPTPSTTSTREPLFGRAFHMKVTVPVLSRLTGYAPGDRIGTGEDLPKGVALQWSRWHRDPRYLLGDDTLPLHRIGEFTAPVRAYRFDNADDAGPVAFDIVMDAYPTVEFQPIDPAIVQTGDGTSGFFDASSAPLWDDLIEWFDGRTPESMATAPGDA